MGLLEKTQQQADPPTMAAGPQAEVIPSPSSPTPSRFPSLSASTSARLGGLLAG